MVRFQLPTPSDGEDEHQNSTTSSASMSKPTSSSPTGHLHSKRTTQSVPLSNPLHSKKTPEAMPEEMAWKDLPDGNKRNEQLFKAGSLGLYNNLDCINSPAAYKVKRDVLRGSIHLDSKLHEIVYGDAEGRATEFNSYYGSYFPILYPHSRVVQQWKKFMMICCLLSVFIDPLFFFLPTMQMDNKCVNLDWSMATSIAIARSVTDFIYFVHMLLQFRLAYVAPESRVVGAGDFVDQPSKIALRYLRQDFLLDLCVALPLPQVMLLIIIPAAAGPKAAIYANDVLRLTVLLQYIPRVIKFLQVLVGQLAGGFGFESAWTIFFTNLLMYLWAGHASGALWYIFGLQRVHQCLRNACSDSQISSCESFMDCGYGDRIGGFKPISSWQDWLNDSNSNSCFTTSGSYTYGIYASAVLLTTQASIITRFIYSLCWGLLQIGTLAGNQIPSYDEWENVFVIFLIGLGVMLFAWLLGNIQNFLLALERRRFEMQIRQRDVEQWMNHRCLPEELQRKVRLAERLSWAATRGVNEELLLRYLPDNIQREIRRHFFKFLEKIQVFILLDEPILDAICERLRQKFYIQGSDILYQGGPIEKMVFIVRGKAESIGQDGNIAPLSEGDVCGEELLTWYLEQFSVYKDGGQNGGKVRFPRLHLFSTRTVKCLMNVEAFALHAADLEEVTTMFPRFLRNPRVQGAIRYESPYWRNRAATHIQVVWRYRQRHLKRKGNSKYTSHSIPGATQKQSADSAK